MLLSFFGKTKKNVEIVKMFDIIVEHSVKNTEEQ